MAQVDGVARALVYDGNELTLIEARGGDARVLEETSFDHSSRLEIARRNPGDLYVGEYEGLYCVGCEEFKQPAQIANDARDRRAKIATFHGTDGPGAGR